MGLASTFFASPRPLFHDSPSVVVVVLGHCKIRPCNLDNDVSDMIHLMPLKDPCEAFFLNAQTVPN
jgi:hypothetical protein